jgi:hypothetical protein
MSVPLISLYFMVGVGVSIGFDLNIKQFRRTDWTGSTRVIGDVMHALFWPVAVTALATMALCAAADR